MAISSASRNFDATDPILETDLELLAKVNTYQQAKFDQGAANLQNEVDNWAMLADVAKPQDRDYINGKLNNLVAGINNMGGVNLGDINNVNSLKSLGYNLKGDQAVMNAVVTTKKMQAFQADAKAKLNSKEGKNFDYTNYEYNLNKWNAWLGDGQTGTSFDGPTDLAPGNMDLYNTKINDAISKLTPDSDEAPQGPDAINYLQVGTKFIKKERIAQLVDSLTTAQDHAVIEAHAWKGLSGTPDDTLLKYTTDGYNSKIDQLKSDYNVLKHQFAQTNDFDQKQRYKDGMDEINQAIKQIGSQKSSLYNETNGKQLNDDQRTALRNNLYFDSYKNGIAQSRAYQQNKTEVKMNAGKAFQLKEAREAYQFNQTQEWRKAQFQLDIRKQDFTEKKTLAELGMALDGSALSALGLQGPSSGAPLAIMSNLGKDDATVFGQNSVTDANANYAGASTNFYNEAYNTLGSLPEYQQYVTKNAAGNLVAKDVTGEKVLQQAVQNKLLVYDNIATLPLEERTKYETELTPDDASLLRSYRNLKQSGLYKQQVNDLEDEAFNRSGLESPANKKVFVTFPNNPQGNEKFVGGFRKPSESYSLRQLKEMQDGNDPRYQQMLKDGAVFDYENWQGKDNDQSGAGAFSKLDNKYYNSPKYLINDYYNSAEKGWKDVSKNYSVYGRDVTLPKMKGGKPNQTLQQYFGDKVRQEATTKKDKSIAGNVLEEDVDLNRIWVQYDANAQGSKLRYKAEVKYRKGDKKSGDKLYNVDLTDDVLREPNGYVGRLYPRDNGAIIYGLMMDKDGVTPLDAKDNYASALETDSNPALSHKYQIVARTNPNSPTLDKTFRVNMLVSKRDKNGKVSYTTVPVRNTYNNLSYDFPVSFDGITDYMNQKLSTPDKAQEFYQLNGIPVQK